MSLPTKTIIEEEWKHKAELFTTNFNKYEENWHNGETYKFASDVDEENLQYCQFKTIIEKQNHSYFVYDEIITRKNKPFFILRLHDNEKRKVLEMIIYFDKGEVVQQIRHMSYHRFFNEIENNEDLIKEESKNTTIIRISFLDFIKNNPNKEQKHIKKEIPEKYWTCKRIIWKVFHTLIFVLAWCSTSIIANIIIMPYVPSFIPDSFMSWIPYTVAGLVAGVAVKLLNEFGKKLKKWLFPQTKDKYQIELEQQLKEQEIRLREEFLQDTLVNLTPAAKQVRMLNHFQQISEINKIKNFKTLKKELIRKFKQNKFAKTYAQNINKWNENWQEKIEFSKSITPHHIEKIKKEFSEKVNNNSTSSKVYLYKPKEIWQETWKEAWEEFQKEKEENKRKLFKKANRNGYLKVKDIREKSPITVINQLVL